MSDLICISMTTWEGDYMKAIVHMMSQLATRHRVLFVDYPFTMKDVVSAPFGKSKVPVGRMLGLQARLRKLKTQNSEVFHLTLPPVFPTNWISNPKRYRIAMQLQNPLIARTIQRAVKKLKFKNPIVINAFNPLIGANLMNKLKEKATIYYCYDEIAAAPWCGRHGAMMEAELLRKADRVVVTSEGLLATKSKQHSQTTLIKNGVDFELFHQAYGTPKSGGRKVVGYVGSVDFRLDYTLLTALIGGHPEWDFHFVGRITDAGGEEALKGFHNVTLFGAVDPASLPHFLSRFDVGIIPFSQNEFTKNIYPLKINEYLAAGLPVVTTDFADLSDFKGVVEVVNTKEAFDQALVTSISGSSDSAIRQRIDLARSNDWSSRAAEMEALLADLV